MDKITSRQNAQVKAVVKLRKQRERERQGLFVVEGLRELGQALRAGIRLEALYYCPRYYADATVVRRVVAQARDQAVEVTPEVFAKMSLREGPDGLLAVAAMGQHALADLSLPAEALVVVVEGVEKPGNLGAIIRTAEAAGVAAVLVCEPVVDIYNPQVIRSSQGLVFAQRIGVGSNAAVAALLQAADLRTLATTPDAEAYYWQTDLTRGSAVIIGSEKAGLSDFWRERCQTQLAIPLVGVADSLNASAAAAVVLYEAVRQRMARTESFC